MLNFCEAIAKYEGFGPSEHRATRNNNPGDIEWGQFARMHGATNVESIPEGITETPRFAFFPSVSQGYDAMKTLLLSKYGLMTVEEMLSKYAPPTENDTQAYIKYVCEQCGCEPTSLVLSVI